MAHILQVGAGSGGAVVLDLLAREPSVNRVSLIEFDVYESHNVYRHLFPASSIGRLKAELAAEWVRGFRSDLVVKPVIADITDPSRQTEFAQIAAKCDIGVCAVDNEQAKHAFDSLMRVAGKPWTLGEVLSGGIGGWVHRFVPGGPCYGCVASHLQREVKEQQDTPPPDYSNPGGAIPETTVSANKASISVIASLHASATLEMLKDPSPSPLPQGEMGLNPAPPSFPGKGDGGLGSSETSLLFSLAKVPGVFDEAFRSYRFRIPRSPSCLICGSAAVPQGDLDVALGEALDRLGT
ncbi:MAG: ThiF family adenylyltransferase [Planctomycetes bacterium]|nr:ThiF family adenylyltransferase [Planctomycetota bacterium]